MPALELYAINCHLQGELGRYYRFHTILKVNRPNGRALWRFRSAEVRFERRIIMIVCGWP